MFMTANSHPILSGLGPSELALIDRTRQLAAEVIGPQSNAVGQTDVFAWDIFRTLANEGLIATAFPREYGGSDASMLLRVRLMEELARVCSVSAAMLAGTDASCRPIVAGASHAVKREVLPELASGSRQCAFALTEPQAGSDLGGLKTVARRERGRIYLTGVKKFITRANVSDYLAVVAREPGSGPGTRGLQAFLVQRSAAGVCVGADEPKMGWYGLPFAEVRLQNVQIDEAWRIGKPGEGMAVAQDALVRARISHAAIALGRMSAALQIAAQHLLQRRARGRPIAQMQGIQWMIADMAAGIESVRCLVYTAALRYDRRDADAPVHASMAKMQSTDLSMKVTTDCLQLLGAYGYSKAYPLERFMRDAKFNQIGEGTSEIHKNVIGAHVVSTAAESQLHPCVQPNPEAFEA